MRKLINRRPGQSAWDVGRERARCGAGGFAWCNTVIRQADGKTVACLIGYPLGDESGLPGEKASAILLPLLELLQIAETRAIDAQYKRMSLIVSDTNATARRLYERYGFGEHATRPIVKENWQHAGQDWILLLKDL